MKTVTWDVPKGMHIQHACEYAIRKAKRNKCNVELTFNDTKLVATPKKTAYILHLEWCAFRYYDRP